MAQFGGGFKVDEVYRSEKETVTVAFVVLATITRDLFQDENRGRDPRTRTKPGSKDDKREKGQ